MIRQNVIKSEVRVVIDENIDLCVEKKSYSSRAGISICEKDYIESRGSKVVIEFDSVQEVDDFIEVLNKTKESMRDSSLITIEEMRFSVRVYNCLKRSGINSKAQLESKSEEDLMKIKNLGKKGILEIVNRKDVSLRSI